MFAPWTRDGHIRADIVQIAPDVSGLIQRVDVRDNQLVTKGQVLFAVDQDRFKLALRQAQAAVAAVRARGQAAEQDAGAEYADQGSLEPGFHEEDSRGLNMATMVAIGRGGVLSRAHRCVSFLFGERGAELCAPTHRHGRRSPVP